MNFPRPRLTLCLAGLAATLAWQAAAWGQVPWQALAHGEYVGPARTAHVPEYQLRVDDELALVYSLAREDLPGGYPLDAGDVLRIESIVDPNLNRQVTVQPDGTIDVLLLGQVHVARRTAEEIRRDLNEQYKRFYKVTDIHVTRVKTQARLEALQAALQSQLHANEGGRIRVSPAGTISLPLIGAVPAQGMTVEELSREVNARYREVAAGLEATPMLAARAPRYVFVLGEVRSPGRYELRAPTSVMQSIALAGGWKNSGNLRQIVVFRRTEDWRLVATQLDLTGPNLDCPLWADEIWLRDSDVVLIPQGPAHGCESVLRHLFGHDDGQSVCTPAVLP